jgi:hypothetical protein
MRDAPPRVCAMRTRDKNGSAHGQVPLVAGEAGR